MPSVVLSIMLGSSTPSGWQPPTRRQNATLGCNHHHHTQLGQNPPADLGAAQPRTCTEYAEVCPAPSTPTTNDTADFHRHLRINGSGHFFGTWSPSQVRPSRTQ